MKNCPEMEEHLNDHVDELLSLPEQQRVNRHLGSCAACREAAESLKELRERTAELPESVPPPRDLWPGIQAAVLAERGKRPRVAPFWRVALPAAAALMLVMLTVWVTLRLTAPGATPEGTSVPAGVPNLQSFRAIETDYRQAADDLLAILQSRRDELSPETVAVVEENLHIINQAIQDAWAALESDPAQLEDSYLINTLYRKKVALLQQAVGLPAES